DPSSLDPGVLRRALESRPLVMQDSGFSEVGEADQPLSRKGPLDPPGARSGSTERLETVEFGPVPPSWRARHPISGDLEPSPSWATASMRRDPVRDTAPTLQPGLESNDLMDPAEFSEPSDPMPSAPTHLPTTDTMTTASRLQSLDLDRLLRPGGEQRLAEQVRWSVDQGLDTAEIKLHPPSLGSLDVRIVQEGDKTHVHFVSAHPIAREVLEAVIPRLREALAQDGVLLGDVSVSDQAPSDRGEAWRERGQSAGTGDHEAEDDEDRSESIGTLSILSRRLDVFT
ncbi:MAG: flagellar hook-length control protein FliK, partial [Thermochromatium sp.]